jgi:type IV pilus assembly protein PilE
MSPRRQAIQAGFTLTELMIVVVAVAILAAIALASYKDQVIRANRSAAQQFMAGLADREQQMLLDLRDYVAVAGTADFPNSPTAGSPGLSVGVPPEASKFYTFSVTTAAGPPPTFLIKGAPIAGTMQAGDKILYINSVGQKWRDFDGNTAFNPGTDIDWNAR